MRVTALVLSWNAPHELAACLASLAQQRDVDLHVLIVDNASDVAPAPWPAQRFPHVELLQNPVNLGFSGGMNAGLRHLAAQTDAADVVVLVNQDTVLAPDCLAELCAPLQQDPDIAACGALISYPDGRLQHAGVQVDGVRATVRHYDADNPPSSPLGREAHEMEWVNGALLALRRTQHGEPLLFDEGFAPAYYEDIDLCRRIRRAGGRLVLVPTAAVTHHEGLSTPDPLRRAALYHRGRLRYLFKHHTPQQLADVFLPAELAVLAEHFASPIEGRALRWAYDVTLSGFDEICAARVRDGAELDAAGRRSLEQTAAALQRGPADCWQRRGGG